MYKYFQYFRWTLSHYIEQYLLQFKCVNVTSGIRFHCHGIWNQKVTARVLVQHDL